MLYDPKWDREVKADPFSLESLIAWLEKQPADGSYPFFNCRGGCLYSQYVTSCGLGADPAFYEDDVMRGWTLFHSGQLRDIAEAKPWTFGAALERARKLAETA